jgi:hypothetical protein
MLKSMRPIARREILFAGAAAAAVAGLPLAAAASQPKPRRRSCAAETI